jgi:hypothetical protein
MSFFCSWSLLDLMQAPAMAKFLILFSLIVLQSTLWAQSNLRLSPTESKIIIRGTSSLHAWQCQVEQSSGQASATINNGTISEIPSLVFNVAVQSIKSIGEKGEYYDKNMDKNIYRALNTEQHPNIAFTLSKFQKKSSAAGTTTVEATGSLRIAGVLREITLAAICIVTPKGLIIEGKVPIRMRDYNVEPPTAIFGTIKTGNEVIIEYKLVYLLLSSGS